MNKNKIIMFIDIFIDFPRFTNNAVSSTSAVHYCCFDNILLTQLHCWQTNTHIGRSLGLEGNMYIYLQPIIILCQFVFET